MYYIFVRSESGLLYVFSELNPFQLLPVFSSDFSKGRSFNSYRECVDYIESVFSDLFLSFVIMKVEA